MHRLLTMISVMMWGEIRNTRYVVEEIQDEHFSHLSSLITFRKCGLDPKASILWKVWYEKYCQHTMSLIGSSHSMRNTKHQVRKKSYAKLKSVGKIEVFLLIDLLNIALWYPLTFQSAHAWNKKLTLTLNKHSGTYGVKDQRVSWSNLSHMKCHVGK